MPQVVLGHRPVLREIRFGADPERRFVASDRLPQVRRPIPAGRADVGIPQVVLGHRPVLREIRFGADPERRLIASDRLPQVRCPIPARQVR